MNISELKKIIKEQQEETEEPGLELPSAAEKTGPSRCQWPQYWNNLWTQSQEAGSTQAFPKSFDEQKKLLFDFSEGEFDDCLYNNQQEAVDVIMLLLTTIAKDPFLWTEVLQTNARKLFNFLYPGELATTRLGIRMAEQELFKLLMKRIATIAKSPFNVPWKSILSRSKMMNPILKSATRVAVVGAGEEVAKQTLKRRLNRETGKTALRTMANPLIVAVAGVPDIAILAAEYLSPEALRSSEYQSMLVKDLILMHRRMYLDRKRNPYYNPDDFDLHSDSVLQKIIRSLENTLEGANYKYIIYVPEKTGNVDDAETDFMGTSTADFNTDFSKKFAEAKRRFSLIPNKSLSLFFDAMEMGWNPLGDDNTRLQEMSGHLKIPIDQGELAYFQTYVDVAQRAADPKNPKILPRSPWIKEDRTIVLIDERLSGGERKEIRVTDYSFGGDEETSSTTAYDPISIVTLFGGYEGMPQRDELAYWMKLNYFDLLDRIKKAYSEKNSR